MPEAPDAPMNESRRYALYFTPAAASPLNRFGSGVLGRDLHGPAIVSPPAGLEACLPALLDIAAEPRRYGFHATLKAPFRLAGGTSEEALLAAVHNFCAHRAPVDAGLLDVTLMGAFVALTPVAAPPALGLLAAECVAHFDALRAPLSDAERQRRLPERLTARQRMLLERWGYPYVFEDFRLHLTLSGPLAADQRAIWHERLARAWDRLKVGPVRVDAISVLRQEEQGADFQLVERMDMRG
jgi:putative phosphonate metabolism protein